MINKLIAGLIVGMLSAPAIALDETDQMSMFASMNGIDGGLEVKSSDVSDLTINGVNFHGVKSVCAVMYSPTGDTHLTNFVFYNGSIIYAAWRGSKSEKMFNSIGLSPSEFFCGSNK